MKSQTLDMCVSAGIIKKHNNFLAREYVLGSSVKAKCAGHGVRDWLSNPRKLK